MTDLTQPIKPTQVAKPVVKAAVQYMIVNFNPTEWATIRLNLLDEDGAAVIAHDVPMTFEESQGWTGGDEYVINLALQKLGISTVTAAPKVK